MSSSKPRPREPLTTRQRSILIAFYNQNPYPSLTERQSLVQSTGRTPKQIQDWFSNRRRTDTRLISTPPTNNISQPQPISIQPVYYSSPSPCSMCPCCSQLGTSLAYSQSTSPDSGYYFPMIYNPPFNNYHA